MERDASNKCRYPELPCNYGLLSIYCYCIDYQLIFPVRKCCQIVVNRSNPMRSPEISGRSVVYAFSSDIGGPAGSGGALWAGPVSFLGALSGRKHSRAGHDTGGTAFEEKRKLCVSLQYKRNLGELKARRPEWRAVRAVP